MTLRRTQYQNATTHVPRGGDAARVEVLTDVESYLEPAAQLRSTGVLSWGVATGLGVTGTSGTPGLRVAPGSAFDALGRLIALEAGGVAVVTEEGNPDDVLGVETEVVAADGVTVPTAGRNGTVVLTVAWREVQDPNATVLLHAPWLRLVPEDAPDDGSAVPLAVVDLDDDGNVDDVNAGSRRLVGSAGGRLRLGLPQTDGLVIGQRVAGELRARSDGGVELAVARGEGQDPATAWAVDPADALFTLSGGLQLQGSARAWRASSGDGGRFRLRDQAAGADRLVVDAEGRVGIGTGDENLTRPLQVQGGGEIHSGGVGAGFSFADRRQTALINNPGQGERWVLYSLDGRARLWSGGDKLTITPAGQVGIGHGDPSLLLDVNGRIRLRQAAESSAGLWLFQTAPNADRAFVGMAGDDDVGFWGNGAGQWGLTMNVNDLSVDLKGALKLPKTGDGSAVFTHGTFTNEGSLTPNNLKLQMNSTSLFGFGQGQQFEFMVGYEFERQSFGGLGQLGALTIRRDFVRVFGVDQNGNAFFSGGKGGYVVDYFVNATGDTVERGDVVVLQTGGPAAFYGTADGIPLPEVDLTDRPYDTRVCGIVADVVADGSLPAIDPREHPPAEDGSEAAEHPLARYAGSAEDDRTKVPDQQMGRMVTLGAWAYCKVDADAAPVEVGDLLTTSATRGHAQKAVDRGQALGAVIGKAMAPLASGRGVLPVLVGIQ